MYDDCVIVSVWCVGDFCEIGGVSVELTADLNSRDRG